MNNKLYASSILYCLAIASLYVFGWLSPGSLNWGFHFLGFLPSPIVVGFGVVAMLLVAMTIRGTIEKILGKLSQWMNKNPVQFLGTVIGIFIISSYTFRIGAPLLGDGFYLVKNFSDAYHHIQPLYTRNEPVATYYYYGLFAMNGSSTYEGFLRSYWIADVLVGVGFIVNVFLIIRKEIRNPVSQLLALLLLLTAPYMQLFFGYVETYSMMLFTISLYVLLALRTLENKMSITVTALSFLLAGVTHYLNALLVFSLLYMGYREWKQFGLKPIVMAGGAFVLGGIFLLYLADFNIENLYSFVPHKHYLSLTNATDSFELYTQAYSLLSLFHVNDILNLYLLLIPISGFLIVSGVFLYKRGSLKSPVVRFLLIAFAPALLFTMFVKYDLGAAKDWDVAASFFFISLLAGCIMFFHYPDNSQRKPVIFLLILSFMMSSSMIALNSTTDPAIKRITTVLDIRTVSQLGQYATTLHLSMYYHQINDNRPVIDLWKEFTKKYPDDRRGYINTIQNIASVNKNDYDAMNEVYESWIRADTAGGEAKEGYAKFCIDAGNFFFQKKDNQHAKKYYGRAVVIDPSSASAVNNLGSVYAVQESTAQAITLFRRAIAMDSTYSDAYYNLGNILIDVGDKSTGQQYIREAAELGNVMAKESLGKNK